MSVTTMRLAIAGFVMALLAACSAPAPTPAPTPWLWRSKELNAACVVLGDQLGYPCFPLAEPTP